MHSLEFIGPGFEVVDGGDGLAVTGVHDDEESKTAIEALDLGIEHMTLEIEFENTGCAMSEHHH